LLDWLRQRALPEEARMADSAYAGAVAAEFLRSLAENGTTTALVFGAHFRPAMEVFFEAAAKSGLRIATGLVLSDRGLLPELLQSPEAAYTDSSELIRRFHGTGRLTYAVTPRFALSTSEAMLAVCGTLLREHPGVLFQTHMNENVREIEEVRQAFPWANDYLAVYEKFALTGARSVLAHNVHPSDSELDRLAASGTSVAHCPCSNGALGSGLFPFRRHLAAGVRVAMGTDVGAGTGYSLWKEGLQAYMVQRLSVDGLALTPVQLLYLSTLAGAEALGMAHETGDLTPGKSADFVYWRAPSGSPLEAAVARVEDPSDLLAAFFTLGSAQCVGEVRVGGEVVFSRSGA
ncbi:MAG: guanine deaminase, partial [Bryobacteraceae bacterium]